MARLLQATFVMAATLSGIVAISMPAVGAEEIAFQGANIGGVNNPVELRGVLARPAGHGPFPAIVLLHTCGGMREHVAWHWPMFLTGKGFLTLSVNSFGARVIEGCGSSTRVKEGLQMQRELAGDAYGALQYLSGLPFVDKDKIGVMGFSFSAHMVNTIMMARPFRRAVRSAVGQDFRAGIAVYGRCEALARIADTPFPLIEIMGGSDIFAKECIELNHPSIKVHVLPGAFHQFDEDARTGTRDSNGNLRYYDRQATDKARAIAHDFFTRAFAMPRARAQASADKQREFNPDRIMKDLDQDDDGRISQEEFRGSDQRFGAMDKEVDGFLSKAELKSGFARTAKRGSGGGAAGGGFLSESEIKSVVVGNTLRFNAPQSGKSMQVHFAADGTATVAVLGRQTIVRKTWFINGKGMLCRTVGQANVNHCTQVAPGAESGKLQLSNKKKGRDLSGDAAPGSTAKRTAMKNAPRPRRAAVPRDLRGAGVWSRNGSFFRR